MSAFIRKIGFLPFFCPVVLDSSADAAGLAKHTARLI